MMLPQVANAAAVTESDVNVKTPDGTADCYFVHPASGTAPGVTYPQPGHRWSCGRRSARGGQRLAESGYSVLVVNPFYRTKKAPTSDAGAATPIPQLLPLAQSLNETTHMTTGCSEGVHRMAGLAIVGCQESEGGHAGLLHGWPDGVSCRGGCARSRGSSRLPVAATDWRQTCPTARTYGAAKSKAHFLIAIAANDDMQAPNEKNVLKETFAKANLPAEIEVYTGAAHGWCPPDSGVYNEPQAEKAWSRLLALYGKALG